MIDSAPAFFPIVPPWTRAFMVPADSELVRERTGCVWRRI